MSAQESPTQDRVVVALATYRRPEMLARTLASLRDQDYQKPFQVVVVDNDPNATASSVASEATGLTLHYVVEPERGIAAARNRCVSEAMKFEPDWIAFIDDDEWADRSWLHELISAVCDSSADGCQGQVKSEFAPGGRPWVRDLGFHGRPLAQTGTSLRTAITGNLLVRPSLLAELNPPFDVRLGHIGGEDTKLTAQLISQGARIIAAPNAIVTEYVPLERQELDWMRRRSRRSAAGWVDIERTVLKTPFWRTRRLAAGLRDGVAGMWLTFVGRTRADQVRVARGSIRISRAAGTFLGLAGRHVEEYGR